MKPKYHSYHHLGLIVIAFAAAGLSPFGSQMANATDYTWDGEGGDNNWGTGANWNPDGAPAPSTTNSLHFAGTTQLTSNNNYTAFDDFQNILFDSDAGSFTVSGNAIDLFGNVTNNSANAQALNITVAIQNGSQSFNATSGDLLIGGADVFTNGNTFGLTAASGKTLTVSALISMGGGVSVTGPGTVILSNTANTYTGATTITSGILSIGQVANGGSSSSIGASSNAASNLVIGSSGTLQFTSSGLQLTDRNFTVSAGSTFDITNASGNLVFTGTNSGAVTINKIGSGILTLGGTTDNVGLGVSITNGTVVLGKTSTSGVHALGGNASVGSGALLKLGGSGGDQIYNSATVTVVSGGAFDLADQSETTGVLSIAGTGIGGTGALLNSGTGASTLTPSSTSLTDDTTIGMTNSSASLTLVNAVSGAFALTKVGAGTLTLSNGTNTFSGGLTINAGTVSIDNNVRLGGTGGTTGAVTLNGGTLRTTAGFVNTHAITIGANGGTINNTANANLNFNTANTLLGSGTLTITGNGAYALATGRAGVVPLNNSNTYSGNVILQDGGLLEYANASALASGATVTVNNNGTLSAQGVAVANAVTVNAGGALAFQNNGNGSFTGTITLAGSTTVRLQNWWSNAVQNGLISGKITGTGPVTINSGTGTGAVLTLTNATSDYTGATTISGTVVNIGTGGTFANVNTASSLGKGSAGGSSADLVLSNGTLRYSGATAQSTDRLFSVGTSGGTLEASGSSTASSLSFTGTGAMGFNSQTGARTLTLTGSNGGANAGSNSLALAIGDNSGATSITKTGAGIWGLGGTNTYSGATTVSAGTLSFLNTAAKSASTTVTAAAGAGVGLGVGGAGFYNSADVDSLFANTLTGFNLDATSVVGIDTTAGDFTYNGSGVSGTRTLAKIGANTLILSGTNTFTNATTIRNGTLEFQSATAMSSNSALTIGSGGTLSLRADADTTFTPASLTGSAGDFTIAVNQLTGAGAGKTLTLANTLNMGSTGNNLTVSSTSGDTLLLSSQLALSNNNASSNTINLSGADMTLNAGVNFNGATNGPFLTVNANSNTLLINGNWTTGGNRWSGIVVNNGTVTMTNGLNGGSSTNNGVYAVLNGGKLNLNNNFAIGGAAAGNNFTINGGTLDNTSGSTKTLGTNPFMRINADFAFSTSGGTGANDLNLGTGAKELGTAAAGSGATRTITTNGSATLTVGGVITSNGATPNNITKAGTGTLVLTGNSTGTYLGATAVQLGKLVVSGFIGNSAVTVTGLNTTLASGSTGTIGSSVTINNGAILAAGNTNAIGTATVVGATTFDTGSIFSWDLAAAPATTVRGSNYDALDTASLGATTGAIFRVVLNGSQDFSASFWDTTRQWTDIFKNGATSLDFETIFSGGVQYYNGGGVVTGVTSTQGAFTISGSTLTWSAVPEPTSAFAGLLLGAGLLRRRRRN